MPKRDVRAKKRVNRLNDAFGAVLKDARSAAGLSQDELGYQSGYHRTYIGQLERGEKSPSLKTIFDLANVLTCAASELISRTESITGLAAPGLGGLGDPEL